MLDLAHLAKYTIHQIRNELDSLLKKYRLFKALAIIAFILDIIFFGFVVSTVTLYISGNHSVIVIILMIVFSVLLVALLVTVIGVCHHIKYKIKNKVDIIKFFLKIK